MNYEQFERVEAYLENRLSDAERRSFEREMSTNAELKSEVEAQQKMRLGLRALAIEKQINEARQRTQSSPKTTIVKKLNSIQSWGLAASVAVMLGAGWLVWENNKTPGEAERRTMAEKEMTDVQYKSMPLDSLQNITKNAESAKAREKAEWYVALAYMHQGQKDKAKAILTQISDNPQHSYQQKAEELLKKGF